MAMDHKLCFALLAAIGCGANPTGSSQDGGTVVDNDFDKVAVAASQCTDGWLVENVPRTGMQPRFAFGHDGNAHVVYYATPPGRTTPLVRHVDERTITDADSLPVPGAPAVAVAPDGTASVFIGTRPDGTMNAFRRVGSDWQQLGGSIGTDSTALPFATIDAAGRSHVSFAASVLYYATDGGNGQWISEQVGELNEISGAAIHVDPAGHVHLFYGANDPKTGMWGGYWTSNASGKWQDTPFPLHELAAADNIDALGRPHIIVYPPDGGHHQWFDNGAWKDEALGTDVGASDMTVDRNGALHLAGFSKAHTLVYANNVGGTWTSSVVSSDDFSSARNISVWLGLDDGNAPHIGWLTPAGGFAIAHRCN